MIVKLRGSLVQNKRVCLIQSEERFAYFSTFLYFLLTVLIAEPFETQRKTLS